MSISYNVKDVILCLLKKWYIIIILGVVFALVSLPFSNYTYQDAVNQYNEKTNLNSLLKEAEAEIERQKETLNNNYIASVSVEFYHYLYCQIIPSVPIGSDSTQADGLQKDIAILANEDLFLFPFYDRLGGEDVYGMSYIDFRKSFSVKIFESEALIEVVFPAPSVNAVEYINKNFSSQLSNYCNQIFPKDIYIENTFNIDDTFLLEDIPYDIEVLELAQRNLDYNIRILKEPSQSGNHLKYMVTSGFLGAVFACFVVLLMDYVSTSKKLLESSNNRA